LESIPGLHKRLKIRAQFSWDGRFNKNGDGVREQKCANLFLCSGKQAEPHMNSTQRPLADLLKQQDGQQRGEGADTRHNTVEIKMP
jgi:hypothetical protein